MTTKKRLFFIVLLSMLIVVISSVFCFADVTNLTNTIWSRKATYAPVDLSYSQVFDVNFKFSMSSGSDTFNYFFPFAQVVRTNSNYIVRSSDENRVLFGKNSSSSILNLYLISSNSEYLAGKYANAVGLSTSNTIEFLSGVDISNPVLISFLYSNFNLVYSPVQTLPTPLVNVNSTGGVSWGAYDEGQPDLRIDRYNPTTGLWNQEAYLDYRNTFWQLSQFGEYRIKAITTSSSYDDSEFAYFEYNGIELPVPNNIRIVGSTLMWDSVSNALQYLIDYSTDGNTWQQRAFIEGTSYLLANVGYYRISVEGTGFPYVDSDWSTPISFVPSAQNQLMRPNVYLQNRYTLTWNAIANASGYNVYQGSGDYLTLVRTLDSNTTSFDVWQNGTYSVQALGNNNYTSSELSLPIVVSDYGGGTIPDPPSPPSDEESGVLAWLKYFIERVDYFFELLLHGIKTVIGGAIDSISTFVTYIGDFVQSVGNLFSFLPDEIVALITSCIFIVSLVGILRVFL